MIKPETETHYAAKTGFSPVRKFVGENPFSGASDIDLVRLLEATEICYEAVGRARKTRTDAKFFRDMLHPTAPVEKWVEYVPFDEEAYCELFSDAPLQLALMLEARNRITLQAKNRVMELTGLVAS